jgi:DNA-binding response OmpR family regulator
VALPGLALLVCSDPAPVADRVRALRSGADDWITKPCHPDELMARLEAVVRRRSAGQAPRTGLTRYELLYELAAAAGRVLEREDIYQRVWGYRMARGDRSVDVFVRKLRQKLERVSPQWRYVHTHFGVGYRFAAEPADGAHAVTAEGAAGVAQRPPERLPSVPAYPLVR